VWKALALLPVVMVVPAFLANLHFYGTWWITLLTVAFLLVNPWLEEAYWRGLLLDRTSHWPAPASLLYISVLFALGHLTLGVHAVAIRNPVTIFAIGIMGLLWGIVSRKTGSLRWAFAGHFLVDAFSLSVPVMLNLYGPGA
jgi:membrane protease YdiL (CAAX protease family)